MQKIAVFSILFLVFVASCTENSPVSRVMQLEDTSVNGKSFIFYEINEEMEWAQAAELLNRDLHTEMCVDMNDLINLCSEKQGLFNEKQKNLLITEDPISGTVMLHEITKNQGSITVGIQPLTKQPLLNKNCRIIIPA